MKEITSSQNILIKEVKSLKSRKYRDEKRLFFVEGSRIVEEAVMSGADIKRIFVSSDYVELEAAGELLEKLHKNNIQVFLLPHKLFKEISDTDNPQGVMAVVTMREEQLDDYITGKGDCFIILDTIQDPGNMGTIIRTADAAGFTGIILSKGCVDLYNPKVLRSTMGSIFHIPVFKAEYLDKTIQKIKSRGIKVYAAYLEGDADCFNVKYHDNCALVIGNEAKGIGEEIISASDILVKIPMPGKAESLNASVSAAILIYEVVRQRHYMNGNKSGGK